MQDAGGAVRVEIRQKRFGEKAVLGPIAFNVEAGEVLGLTGPSGIGKSTLLRIIAGLDQDYEGKVLDAGRLAMVFQEPTLLPWRSALQNLTLTTGCGAERALQALDEVGLSGEEESFPHRLSLGQQRRLALARAIAVTPDSLLLDEAFVSLDDATALRMRSLTLRLLEPRQVASLLVSHDLSELATLSDRVVYLDGKPAEIKGTFVFDEDQRTRDQTEAAKELRHWMARTQS